ncbi:MAG: hypothetical protein ACJASR_002614 [Psychroserpens sp.]
MPPFFFLPTTSVFRAVLEGSRSSEKGAAERSKQDEEKRKKKLPLIGV